jgi:hypothetical protein
MGKSVFGNAERSATVREEEHMIMLKKMEFCAEL